MRDSEPSFTFYIDASSKEMVERVILGQPGVTPVVVGSRVTSYIVQGRGI